jgi:hypothetical protein
VPPPLSFNFAGQGKILVWIVTLFIILVSHILDLFDWIIGCDKMSFLILLGSSTAQVIVAQVISKNSPTTNLPVLLFSQKSNLFTSRKVANESALIVGQRPQVIIEQLTLLVGLVSLGLDGDVATAYALPLWELIVLTIIRIFTQQKMNFLLITTRELGVLITVCDPLLPDFG